MYASNNALRTLRRVNSVSNLRGEETDSNLLVPDVPRSPTGSMLDDIDLADYGIASAQSNLAQLPERVATSAHAITSSSGTSSPQMEPGRSPVIENPYVPSEDHNGSQETLTGRTCRRLDILKEIWLALLLILVPMLLIAIVLTGFVAIFKVRPEKGLFSEPPGWNSASQPGRILLAIQTTWLAFVASRASQCAALLSGPLMELWRWRTARSLIEASSKTSTVDLPTPYQLGLLIGVCTASFDRLRRWTSYHLFRRQGPGPAQDPPALLQAAMFSYLLFALALAMLVADATLHYTTETIEYCRTKLADRMASFGRGLSPKCQDFDRRENYGLPCTVNITASLEDISGPHNGALRLYHNKSDTSNLLSLPGKGAEQSDVVVLTPKPQNLPSDTDYRASTIGVTISCKPITPRCNFGSWGPDDIFDPDVPPLAFKFASNMIISFFTDDSWTTPYNPVGYNPQSGQSDPNIPAWPDNELINQVHVAVAARFASTATLAGTNLSNDPGFYDPASEVFDVVLGCSYQAVEVEYTWFMGTVKDYTATPFQNGNISEMWHGLHIPNAVSSESPALQSILDQAAMEPSSKRFASTWAHLYSYAVMAAIGGYTSERANMLQQVRTPVLVVKVWIPALVFMLLFSTVYICLGVALAMIAVRTSSEIDLRDAVNRLSIWGLVHWAASSDEEGDRLPGEKDVRVEHSLVAFTDNGTVHSFARITQLPAAARTRL